VNRRANEISSITDFDCAFWGQNIPNLAILQKIMGNRDSSCRTGGTKADESSDRTDLTLELEIFAEKTNN